MGGGQRRHLPSLFIQVAVASWPSFPLVCCAPVIHACRVESVRPAVTAHASWLSVLPCLAVASGGPVAGGVVQVWVGQKRLNYYILSLFCDVR
jgi:hypothetical protein